MYVKKNSGMKVTALLLALVLLVGCVIGGTIAYLVTKTDPVVNTFATSNITITLTETEGLDLKMVPGQDIKKDPVVAVEVGSESCYLFVKVEETNTTNYIEYTIAEGWTLVPGETNVYYRTVAADAAEREFSVLAGDKVTVPDAVTKKMMEDAKGKEPTLTFTAYAVQQAGFNTAGLAWAEAVKLPTNPTT